MPALSNRRQALADPSDATHGRGRARSALPAMTWITRRYTTGTERQQIIDARLINIRPVAAALPPPPPRAAVIAVPGPPRLSLCAGRSLSGKLYGEYGDRAPYQRWPCRRSKAPNHADRRSCTPLTVMTCRDTPDHESHDRFPLFPRPFSRKGRRELRESLTRLSH